MKVEGIDYSPEGIESIRQELATLRDGSYDFWPNSVTATLVLTHAIALLAHLVELIENPSEAYTAYLHRKYPEIEAADRIMHDLGLNG